MARVSCGHRLQSAYNDLLTWETVTSVLDVSKTEATARGKTTVTHWTQEGSRSCFSVMDDRREYDISWVWDSSSSI